MSDRCMEFREMSPGGREMATSGGEREEHRAWTHDTVEACPIHHTVIRLTMTLNVLLLSALAIAPM